MHRTFFRTLAVIAIMQFFVTRTMAGRVAEEGHAERMWMLYPVNVLMNAVAWTLLISAGSGTLRIFRRA